MKPFVSTASCSSALLIDKNISKDARVRRGREAFWKTGASL